MRNLSVIVLIVVMLMVMAACGHDSQSHEPQRQGFAHVIDVANVAGFKIKFQHTTTAVVADYFGKASGPTTSTSHAGCSLSYRKLGLTFTWFRNALTGQACGYLYAVTATVDGWRTTQGLRTGDAASVMHRLYPEATNQGSVTRPAFGLPNASTRWYLSDISRASSGFQPILTAYLRNARVVAIGVVLLLISH